MIFKRSILAMVLLLFYTPSVAAASVFSNPAFDIVLLLIVAFVLFVIIRNIIGSINK